MFTKKFLESHFTPSNFVASRQKKKPADEASDIEVVERMRESASPASSTALDEDAPSLLSRHRGKLAMGAAAMLGIAAFYHWRESKLAKEDEEEYARLQRLKAALDAFESQQEK